MCSRHISLLLLSAFFFIYVYLASDDEFVDDVDDDVVPIASWIEVHNNKLFLNDEVVVIVVDDALLDSFSFRMDHDGDR